MLTDLAFPISSAIAHLGRRMNVHQKPEFILIERSETDAKAGPVLTDALEHLRHQPSKTPQPTFDCRIWQRGAKWHWQVVNAERMLAHGIAQSHLAARNAAVLQCLQRLIHLQALLRIVT